MRLLIELYGRLDFVHDFVANMKLVKQLALFQNVCNSCSSQHGICSELLNLILMLMCKHGHLTLNRNLRWLELTCDLYFIEKTKTNKHLHSTTDACLIKICLSG